MGIVLVCSQGMVLCDGHLSSFKPSWHQVVALLASFTHHQPEILRV